MKKTLRIVALTAGIISVVTAVVLGIIYLENIAETLNKAKAKISELMNNKKSITEDFDIE